MTFFDITSATTSILQAAGWDAKRKVDVTALVAILRAAGYEVSALAEQFLGSFSGIHLSLPHGGLSGVDFNVIEQLRMLEDGETEQLEQLVGSRLCPIGIGGRFLIFITPSGNVIFLHDEWLLYLRARDVRSALELICDSQFSEYERVELTSDRRPLLM